MVSGVETGLIFRATSAFPGAAFGQREDETNPLTALRNGAAEETGTLPSAVIRPFGNGESEEGGDEGPFFVTGLNGLLAPPSIVAVQEDGSVGDSEEEDREGAAGIAQPSEPAGDEEETAEASAADGEEETGPGELTEEEQQTVDSLKERDAEVRRHEQAHKAVGGQYAGSISYSYESGPDGRRYAVGGEVPIDASPIAGDPEATIRKLQQVRSAALAPAEPSGADRAVAAQASQGIQQARAEQAKESAEELEELQGGGDEESGESAEASAEPGTVEPEAPGTIIDGGREAGISANPFAGGDVSGETEGNAFSVRSIAAEGTGSGNSASGPSNDNESDRFGLGQSRRSPFDFSPSSGRQTLDISV